MENEPILRWTEAINATFALRSQRLAENITKLTALQKRMIERQKTLPPPTFAERLRSRISLGRMWLGSKIAGADLSEPDWLDD